MDKLKEVLHIIVWVLQVPAVIVCIKQLMKSVKVVVIEKHYKDNFWGRYFFVFSIILMVVYILELIFVRSITDCWALIGAYQLFLTIVNKNIKRIV